jgi:hypothetical protein
MVEPTNAYFLDIQSHEAFEAPEKAKALVQVVLRNWPALLDPYVMHGFSPDLSFETAFRAQKSRFTVLFEVDGVCFSRGGTVFDGKLNGDRRGASTSMNVVRSANRMLGSIARVVEFVSSQAEVLAPIAQARTGQPPTHFNLHVSQVGPVTVLTEQNSNMRLAYDGSQFTVLDEQLDGRLTQR